MDFFFHIFAILSIKSHYAVLALFKTRFACLTGLWHFIMCCNLLSDKSVSEETTL